MGDVCEPALGTDPNNPDTDSDGRLDGTDRSSTFGPNLWNAAPPDGNINIIDIGLAVQQFGHICA